MNNKDLRDKEEIATRKVRFETWEFLSNQTKKVEHQEKQKRVYDNYDRAMKVI